ncbi:7602_t:CDS:2, partial [Dentiscutata erythropus]
MYTASSSSIENIGTFNESSMPSSAISSKINNNRDSAYICDEEIKCLFFREKFSPATYIDKFVKKIFGQDAALLTKENINNYINEKVTMNVLNRFIEGTNQKELQKCGAVKKLVQLIREMFKIYWQGKNIDQ